MAATTVKVTFEDRFMAPTRSYHRGGRRGVRPYTMAISGSRITFFWIANCTNCALL
jgi:hypothetical protein